MLFILRRMRWVRSSIFRRAPASADEATHPQRRTHRGGLNINSVPDRTRFDVDIRSAPQFTAHRYPGRDDAAGRKRYGHHAGRPACGP